MSDEISGSETTNPAAGETDQRSDTTNASVATEGINSEAASELDSDPRTHRFECRSCGYVYDPAEGVKKLGIEPNTPSTISTPSASDARCAEAGWVRSATSAQ